MKVLIGLLLLFAVIGFCRTRALARSSGSSAPGAASVGFPMPDVAEAVPTYDDDTDQQHESEEDFLARERMLNHDSHQYMPEFHQEHEQQDGGYADSTY